MITLYVMILIPVNSTFYEEGKMPISKSRYEALKAMLTERRNEVQHDVESHAAAKQRYESRRPGTTMPDIQDEIEAALFDMNTETLAKFDEALSRLELGTYGNCSECHDEISEKRLRALPFTTLCQSCETTRELAEIEERARGTKHIATFETYRLFD